MLISISIQKDFIYILLFIFSNFICSIISKFDVIRVGLHEFINCISKSCLIMFYILQKYILREKIYNKKEENIETNIGGSLNFISLIICSIILNSISWYDFGYNDVFNTLDINITMILLLMLIETIFFNKFIYSHQILSINIIIIISFYLIIRYIESEIRITNILFLLRVYIVSFNLHLIKYINTKYFINIYLLGSINGISQLIIFFNSK